MNSVRQSHLFIRTQHKKYYSTGCAPALISWSHRSSARKGSRGGGETGNWGLGDSRDVSSHFTKKSQLAIGNWHQPSVLTFPFTTSILIHLGGCLWPGPVSSPPRKGSHLRPHCHLTRALAHLIESHSILLNGLEVFYLGSMACFGDEFSSGCRKVHVALLGCY